MAGQSTLNTEQISVLMSEGTFHGLSMLMGQNKITAGEASGVMSRVYNSLLEEIQEAKRELKHISAVLDRLEHTCHNGKHSAHGTVTDGNHVHLNQNMLAFDGWVISLMETDLTMTGLLNPKFTRKKIADFGNAMNALMDKRSANQHPLMDDRGLFSAYLQQ
ncbi:MAG: hypothetical protein ABI791_06870 [Acidobacteriota bacterium]